MLKDLSQNYANLAIILPAKNTEDKITSNLDEGGEFFGKPISPFSEHP
ncbi:MAG: hypothetical protein INR73_20115 [Williamsia sp.]|nr:hypothetical protein [Williamsia sp.]